MLTLTRDPADQQTGILKIAGEVTVEDAAQLHQALLDGLNECGQLQIDCQAATGIDFFALQLLCSAHRTSIVRDKRLYFSGRLSATVAEGLRRIGFARQSGCSLCPASERCLWI